MQKSILFYWSKGAKVRVKLLHEIFKSNRKKEACYLNSLADKLGLSHVAVKKHLRLLAEESFVREINPGGKPVYLELTEKGLQVLNEFKKK
jgi:predicted transcriptional regulator